MNEFSLEAISEKIYHYKTKEYFKEIVSSYNNENYRSAAVMLWSVAVIDLVFKLNDLVDLHSDKTAESILKQMSDIQNKDRKSSAWELKLVEAVSKRTQLLSSPNIAHLDYLYQQRNLSAHPVLDANLELHRPNKETIRALIVNTIEGILSKPPFFSKDVFTSIVEDLDASKSFLEDDPTKLKHYLESRFLSKMTDKVEIEVFKNLWKFSFKLKNAKADENRNINFLTLKYLFEKNKTAVTSFMGKEKHYFSDISKDKDVVEKLIVFLSLNPDVYDLLESSATIIIDDAINKSERNYYRATFKHKTLTDFYDSIVDKLENKGGSLWKSDVAHLRTISDAPGWIHLVNKIQNIYYGLSDSYATAESRFSTFISSSVDDYDEEDMEHLINQIDGNGQIHGRSFNKHINTKVRDAAKALSFDYSSYSNFVNAVS
ncbi:hypothetical protein ACSWYU_005194 [Vibrio harveyi]